MKQEIHSYRADAPESIHNFTLSQAIRAALAQELAARWHHMCRCGRRSVVALEKR